MSTNKPKLKNYCCDQFKEEYELDKYEQDGINISAGKYYFCCEGLTASSPLIYCPYCGKKLMDDPL